MALNKILWKPKLPLRLIFICEKFLVCNNKETIQDLLSDFHMAHLFLKWLKLHLVYEPLGTLADFRPALQQVDSVCALVWLGTSKILWSARMIIFGKGKEEKIMYSYL